MVQNKFIRSFIKQTRSFTTTNSKYDLAIIGGGPGGYTAAIKAAQLGLKVACVEKRLNLGGTCLNCGCIPSKSLLNSSHHVHMLRHGTSGFPPAKVSVDLDAILDEKNKVIKMLNAGIHGLFKKNKVDYINGHGRLISPTEIQVGDDVVISAKDIILATGSEVTPFPHDSLKVDGKTIISSTEILCLDRVPKDLVVIGGGAIGLELATVWKRFGSNVTILEYADKLCSAMDHEVSVLIRKLLEKEGIVIKTGTKVLHGEKSGDLVTIKTDSGDYTGDTVLVAMGRRPYLENLGLDKLGIKVERGKIIVDDKFRVIGHENIRAIGDIVMGPMLAHKAEEDGMAALGFIVGQNLAHVDHGTIPSVIYTTPEIAGVGATENELKAKNIKYKKSVFPFAANSRARIYGETDGFVKILADESNKIIGGWIVGPCASELIQQITLAMNLKLTTEQVTKCCFAHPSLSEAVKEACLGIHAKPIHF